MYVGLAKEHKGTHMSRFIEILNQQDIALSLSKFEQLVRGMISRLDAQTGRLEVNFPFFMKKMAPVTKTSGLLDYDITLIGEVHDHGRYTQSLKLIVPVTSLCPCSKLISERGAHNQRSHITLEALTNPDLVIEDLITSVEEEASCQLYSVLKRADEKHVTEQAYDNPKFVEDLVRDTAKRLKDNPDVIAFTVESENFESIHNHSAYAQIIHQPL